METGSIMSTKRKQAVATGRVGLPVVRDLRPAYLFSLIVALLMVATAVVGLIYRPAIYPSEELLLSFVPSDAFSLAVGAPILLGAMWLARRGKVIGLLGWPGALFYVLYMYLPYVIGIPFGVLFLLHLLLVVLSAYTLAGLVAAIDGEAVRRQMAGSVPVKSSAGVLIGLALLVAARQTALIVASLMNQTPVSLPETLAWIADFTVAVPMLLVGGVQLWQCKALGYAAGAGLLLGYGLLALSLVPFFVLQARITTAPLDVGGLVTVLVMAALCFVPLAFFARAAAKETWK